MYQHALIRDWDALEGEAETIATLGLEGAAVRPFVMLPLEDNPGRHLIRAQRFNRERFVLSELDRIPRPKAKPERIDIGYFSANFHNHAVMYLMAGLLEAHDRS